MATPDPRAGFNTLSNINCDSEVAIVMNADIKSLAAFKDTAESTLVKEVFESVIVILTLARVSFPVRISSLRSLISETTRME